MAEATARAAQPKIVHFLYQAGDGGLDRVAVLLANEMAELGHDCELWMARADGAVAHLISDKVTVRIVTAPHIAGRGLHLLMQIPALARQITRSKPAVIFSAGNQSNLTLALARFLSGGAGTAIFQKITNPVERPLMGRARRLLRRWRFGLTARLADRVLTLSEADARGLAAHFPKLASAGLEGRFAAVKNAYVTPAMLKLGAERVPRDPTDTPQLLAVGRISQQKDYETLLRALALIADHAWHLTVLGDGPLAPPVRALAEDLGLARRVEFAGFVDDTAAYYAQNHILVLSSRWEGFAAVPLEAMAAGCLVVATDCSPALSDILRQAGTDVVPIADPAALSAAIVQAIEIRTGSSQLQELAAEYSITASAQDHLRIAEPFLK